MNDSSYFYVMTMSITYENTVITGTWHGFFEVNDPCTELEAYTMIRNDVYAMAVRVTNEKLYPYPPLKASDIESLPPVVLYYHLGRNTTLQMP